MRYLLDVVSFSRPCSAFRENIRGAFQLYRIAVRGCGSAGSRARRIHVQVGSGWPPAPARSARTFNTAWDTVHAHVPAGHYTSMRCVAHGREVCVADMLGSGGDGCSGEEYGEGGDGGRGLEMEAAAMEATAMEAAEQR